ncbi:odorant receptor 67d-like [Drosophila willistoni]|uniref:odorant receptor 67d-like n=1 Tax=Drosophila willistoni TaxID=7260 RepID=UPI000C26CC1E|nr:odorant receptor 67d-like [Drosophila willistoni]
MSLKPSPPSEDDEESCLARYRRIIKLLKFCARLCGADITELDYKMNVITYTICFLFVVFCICTVYTIYVGIVHDGDWSIILQATCFVGAGVQGITKLICCISKRHEMREAQIFLDAAFMKYEQLSGGYRDALLEAIALSMSCIKGFAFVYIFVVAVLLGFPAAYYIFYNKKILIMQFLLPGLDPEKESGYIMLFVVHFVCLAFGAFGNYAADMYLFVFISNAPLLKNILRCKFEDLNIKLRKSHNRNDRISLRIHWEMVDIVQWHQEYLNLLDRSERTFFVIIFVHVFASALSTLCTLYCILIGVWPAAPAYLLYSVMNLYLFCGLGSVVTISNDDCCEIIYTQCLWYKLPVAEQRLLMFMLRKSQSTPGLSVGNMLPLTVNTALQLTKAVYSLLMLLMRDTEN